MIRSLPFSRAADDPGGVDAVPRRARVVDHAAEGVLTAEELLTLCDTGDLVFTAGNTLGSTLIKWFTWSRWSHVAVVDRCRGAEGGVWLWESVIKTDSLVDAKYLTRCKKGARLVDAAPRLAASPCSDGWPDSFAVGVMKLRAPPEMRALLAGRMQRYQDFAHPIGYERDRLNLMRTSLPGLLGENAYDPSQLFCSELVAETLKFMGVVDERYNSSMCRPDTFVDLYDSVPYRRDRGLWIEPELHVYRVRREAPAHAPKETQQ